MAGKIKYREGYKYVLHETYSVQTSIRPPADIITPFITLTASGLLILRAGYASDGPSGPTIDTKNFIRGAFGHDADRDLDRWCKEDGMWGIRRWWVLRGVRLGGEGAAAWQEDEVLEAP